MRLGQCLESAPDLIVTTGGVSVGAFDFVKEVFGRVGGAIDFWKVRMKPGKPLAFGLMGTPPLFGLPGNPVSCMVNFLQFVRPWIRKSLGTPNAFLPVVPATAGCAFRERPGRASFVRVTLVVGPNGWIAESTGSQSSGVLTSMARAHGFLLLDEHSSGVGPGDPVRVQLFDSSFLDGGVPAYPW